MVTHPKALRKGESVKNTLLHTQISGMGCLRIRGHCRPNHTPGTKSGAFGVGDRCCPPLHGRVGGTSAHPHSATACRVRRSLAHPGAYAVASHGSEYLPQALRHASASVFAIPPSAKALAPWLMRLVRPRCSSGIPFYRLRCKP